MRKKYCKKCGYRRIKKDGFKRGKQRFKCNNCGYVFQISQNKMIPELLWEEYTVGKQTYQQLGEKYKVNIKTIQRKLDMISIQKKETTPKKTILLIDTTYFGRKYGIMVFRSYELKKNLYWKEVKRENKQEYLDGISYL